MWTAFPPSDYYGASAPPRAFNGRRIYPTPDNDCRGPDRRGTVPTFNA
ncbi:hypothetical protein FAGKG844_1000005 [Frankia sp. AgKG'84/4]